MKYEPDDSLASADTAVEDTPAWASELTASLSDTKLVMSPAAEVPIKNAMKSLPSDGPACAQQLHELLEGHCNKAAAKCDQADESITAAERVSALKANLRPKGSLQLRLGAAHAESTADDNAVTKLAGSSHAEPGDRISTAAYEKVASAALKTVKVKRAEAARDNANIEFEGKIHTSGDEKQQLQQQIIDEKKTSQSRTMRAKLRT